MKYRIRYTNPVGFDPHQIQRTLMIAANEAEARENMVGCEVIDVEAIEPEEEAERVEIGGILQWLGEQELTPNLNLVESVQPVNALVLSGAVNPDGSLKPYRVSGSHRGTPMTLEELGDDGQQYPY